MGGNNYVSGSIKRLRRRLQENPDKTEAFKNQLKDTVAIGIEDFEKRLIKGQVKIETVSDFEKLAKLGLLLHGEATEKVEHTTDIEEVTNINFEELKDMSELQALKEKLAIQMNRQNENA